MGKDWTGWLKLTPSVRCFKVLGREGMRELNEELSDKNVRGGEEDSRGSKERGRS